MHNSLNKIFLSLLLTGSLVGCAAVVKTPYEAPAVQIPNQFGKTNQVNQQVYSTAFNDQWWTLFGDENLNQLINQVIKSNPNLAIAGINLQQARIQTKQSQSQQGIRISNAGANVGHRFDLDGGGDSSNGISLNYPGLSYELDLFGKLANQTEAARWEALATEQDLQATAQSLIADTTSLYWQLAYLNERLAVAKMDLANAEKTYQLVRTQYNAGAVSGLDLTQAEQFVQSQKASLSQIEQQKVETRTALAVLLNQPVQQVNIAEPQRLSINTLPTIASGLPAELLSRRPDLNAAELRLRRALADKDAKKASYYPSVSLTGTISSGSSTSLSNALSNPVAVLGAGLSLPFLQWNDMKRDLKINELDYEKAIVGYRQTLYQAFAEVENTLSARTEIDRQVQLQERNVELANRTERLTEVRYRNGAIPLKTFLDAQQTARNARLNLVQTKQSQYNAYVNLFKALGGSPIKELN